MRRNMQNLSFLAIIGALLSCAFFFSQQSKSNLQYPLPQETETMEFENTMSMSIEIIPDCTNLNSDKEILACYAEVASLSQQLLNLKIDAILEMETESQRRMDFMEVQLAWEESRDKECNFIQNMSQLEEKAELNKLICLSDQNLARCEQLQSYYCEWYDTSPSED
jgi:uncharacterized protein YecT (DUF1311 family)